MHFCYWQKSQAVSIGTVSIGTVRGLESKVARMVRRDLMDIYRA